MEEVRIGVNEFGTLFAILPDGKVRTILVDVHDTQHYGILRIGAPTDYEDRKIERKGDANGNT